MSKLVVFTDLDGTLLDHATYTYQPARTALAALKRVSAALVLASSKTSAEISRLHAELQLGATPAIVENGAGLYTPGQGETGHAPSQYNDLRACLERVPERLRAGFRGFGDMSTDEISRLTGLTADAADAAAQRAYSEPGLWTGSPDEKAQFVDTLQRLGLTARQGGRFLTLSFGATKADQMGRIARALKATQTLALGDAPNDREMLEQADFGVIIRNDHGAPMPELAGERSGRILRTALPGPAGWNAAVLAHLKDHHQKGPVT